MEDEAKKEKDKRQRSGEPKFRPQHLNSSKSWVNPKKKKKKNIFQSFQISFKIQIFNSKIFIPKFSISHSQCPILNSNLQFKKKIQTSYFMIKIPSLNFQNSKAQNFK